MIFVVAPGTSVHVCFQLQSWRTSRSVWPTCLRLTDPRRISTPRTTRCVLSTCRQSRGHKLSRYSVAHSIPRGVTCFWCDESEINTYSCANWKSTPGRVGIMHWGACGWYLSSRSSQISLHLFAFSFATYQCFQPCNTSSPLAYQPLSVFGFVTSLRFQHCNISSLSTLRHSFAQFWIW